MKVNVAVEGLTPRLPARSTYFKCKYPSIQANSGPFCCPPQSSGTGPSLHSYLHCSCRLIPQGSWAAGPLSPQPSSKPGQERSCKVFCPPESNSETNHPQFAHLPPPPSPPVLFTLPPRSANACCCLQPGIPRIPAGAASTQSLPSVVSTHLIMPLFTTLSGTSTISLSPSNAPKQTNWEEAPLFPSRNHPGPVHSAPIVPSTDMSEGFPT